jgi:hypothetical protein
MPTEPQYTTLVEDWRTVTLNSTVRAEHDDWPDVIGVVDHRQWTEPKIHSVRINGAMYSNLNGWRLYTATPEVVLPTEPGWYLDKDREAWELSGELWLYGEL